MTWKRKQPDRSLLGGVRSTLCKAKENTACFSFSKIVRLFTRVATVCKDCREMRAGEGAEAHVCPGGADGGQKDVQTGHIHAALSKSGFPVFCMLGMHPYQTFLGLCSQ